MIIPWVQPTVLVSSRLVQKRCSEVTAFASFAGNGQRPTDTIGLKATHRTARSPQAISLRCALSAMVSRQHSAASLERAETFFSFRATLGQELETCLDNIVSKSKGTSPHHP